MHITDYHAKYFAHALTRRCPPDSVEKLAAALADTQDQINKQRENLICRIENNLAQKTSMHALFTIVWRLA
jgi:hypothetical protein